MFTIADAMQKIRCPDFEQFLLERTRPPERDREPQANRE